MKTIIKSLLFRKGNRRYRVIGGALKGMSFHFDLRVDTQAWRGIYEQSLQLWLQHYVKPNSICLDIGSANGYFALLMAKLAGPDGRVYAFEPSNLSENILVNFEINSAYKLSQLKIYNKFVSGSKQASDDSVSIDELIADGSIARVDVVKIDVDGGEVDVINGMVDALARFHPHIYVEVHSRELLAGVEAKLSEFGYHMKLEDPPPHELRPLEYNSFFYSEEP